MTRRETGVSPLGAAALLGGPVIVTFFQPHAD
jgi:hypothetical protein